MSDDRTSIQIWRCERSSAVRIRPHTATSAANADSWNGQARFVAAVDGVLKILKITLAANERRLFNING